MLASPLLDVYSLSPSLGCKTVINFLVLQSVCLNISSSILRMLPSILQGGQLRFLSLCRACFPSAFSFVWDSLFLFLISWPLVWCCQLVIFSIICNFLQYFQVLVILWDFYTGNRWWLLNGPWVTTNLLRSLRLFWFFSLILTMPWSEWFHFFL